MTPILQPVDFDAVREALRREREARIGSRAKMEERSGVSEGTIFKIETKWTDPRTKAPYVPGADLVLRLVTALPDITVSEFFARIEGLKAQPAQSTNAVSNSNGGGTPLSPAPPLPLDDTNAVITRNTNAIARLVGAIDQLSDRLGPSRSVAVHDSPLTIPDVLPSPFHLLCDALMIDPRHLVTAQADAVGDAHLLIDRLERRG